MNRRPRRRVPAGVHLAVGLTLVLAFLPEVASAHGATASRFDAPLPLWLLLGGAGATVAATAALVATGDRESTIVPDRATGWTLGSIPSGVLRRVRLTLGMAFFAAVLAVLLSGIAGRQVAAENLATVLTWPLWFHGFALVAILVGNPWRTLAPWRQLYRGLVRLEGRTLAAIDGPPAWLGHWPATVGFLALFGVVENLTVVPRSPRLTAGLVAVLAVAMVLGSVAVGPAWLRRGDPLGVLFSLFGRVSPISVSEEAGIGEEEREEAGDGKEEMEGEVAVVREEDKDEETTVSGRTTIHLRPPWRGCERPVADGSLVVFAIAMVYTVSFDGASALRAFQTALFAVRDVLGTGPGTSVLLYVAGLLAFVAVYVLAVRLGESLGAGRADRWPVAARAFAPSLLPIAAGYEIAHVYPYVFENLGVLPAVALDPLGIAVDAISPLAWLSLPAFWSSQVLLIVLGHVVAVVAAHRVARRRFDGPRAARRGHLPLVLVMVGYTALSLWIVSAPVVA